MDRYRHIYRQTDGRMYIQTGGWVDIDREVGRSVDGWIYRHKYKYR